MAGERIGKLQILGTLGTGAHSTILHVRRHVDGKQYVLKVVPIDGPDDLKFLEQAKHEYTIGSLLDHPNLLRVHSFEVDRDWLFRTRKARLLLEYVNGKTLDQLPLLPITTLVQIFQRTAAALAHMHRRSVCHADLKPGNMMLSKTGAVKVIDFGLAWNRGESRDRVQGTPEYMAPETAKRKIVNEQTDIFNFGATMYRLATFRLPPTTAPMEGVPLDGKTWTSQLVPVKDLNREVPDELGKLIHRCLAYNAKERPGRVGEALEILDRLQAELVKSSSERLEALEF